MEYSKFIEPKQVDVCGIKFAMSQIPAYYAHDFYGAMLDSLRDYSSLGYMTLPKETVAAMFAYCAYTKDGGATWIPIDGEAHMQKAFGNNRKAEILLLKKLLEYNFDFFLDGSLLEFPMGLQNGETETAAERAETL